MSSMDDQGHLPPSVEPGRRTSPRAADVPSEDKPEEERLHAAEDPRRRAPSEPPFEPAEDPVRKSNTDGGSRTGGT
jgi:hypothetical protein